MAGRRRFLAVLLALSLALFVWYYLRRSPADVLAARETNQSTCMSWENDSTLNGTAINVS